MVERRDNSIPDFVYKSRPFCSAIRTIKNLQAKIRSTFIGKAGLVDSPTVGYRTPARFQTMSSLLAGIENLKKFA